MGFQFLYMNQLCQLDKLVALEHFEGPDAAEKLLDGVGVNLFVHKGELYKKVEN